jgi:hypothetical protein
MSGSFASPNPRRFFGQLAALIMLGATPTVAAAACVEQPNLQEASDGHWYYRIDRLNHHRCWYLKQESPSAAPSPAESGINVANVTTSISSFFSAWKSPVARGAQQDVASVAAAAEVSAESGAPKRGISAPAHSRHADLKEREAERLRSNEPKPEHAEAKHELDPAQREALFEEFLRWSLKRQ